MAAVPPPACEPALLALAESMVREAGEVALEGFRRPDLPTRRKADGTIVTAYDQAVERLLRDRISGALPDDGVLGEEEAEQVGTSGRRWILDPVDGTSPYAAGVVTWGVLVACEDEHGPLLGAAACPWAGETVLAGRGLGSTFAGQRARASRRQGVAGAVLVTSGIEWWPAGAFQRLTAAGVKVRTWGNAYGLALVATGRVDAFFDGGVKPWDVAPAPVLMTEAGGCFATLDGSGSIDAGTALLCGEPLLEPILSLLQG